MRNRGGFTLIEVLVVIAIIALMLAIMFPVLAAARRQANAIKCAGHLRELGDAFEMYAMDNDDYLPVVQADKYVVGSISSPGAGNSAAFWWDFLQKYIAQNDKLGTTSTTVAEAAGQRRSILWGCPAWEGWYTGALGGVNRNIPVYGMSYEARMRPDYPSQAQPSRNPTDPTHLTSAAERAFRAGTTMGNFFKKTQWVDPSKKALLGDGKFFLLEVQPPPTDIVPPQESNLNITYSTPAVPGQTTFDFYRHGTVGALLPGTTQIDPQRSRAAFNILFLDGHVRTCTDPRDAYHAVRLRFPG